MKNGLDLLPGEVINGRFVVETKLGEGGFGAVYRMRDRSLGNRYAMKVEMRPKAGQPKRFSSVKLEVLVLLALKKSPKSLKGKHACQIMDQGQNDTFRYVIMTLLGPSLQDLKRKQPDRKFSLSTALRVGIQCLHAIQDLHTVGFIHRDIKPANFATGTKSENEVRNIYVIDFGLAREYMKSNGEIKAPRDGANFRGTTRYAPVRCHELKELARSDDLEMWFYQQVEMTIGRLPWVTIEDRNDILKNKKTTRMNGKLFDGSPTVYAHLCYYIDNLNYWEDPDYNWIEEGLRHVIHRLKIYLDDPYDWEKTLDEAATANANRPPDPDGRRRETNE